MVASIWLTLIYLNEVMFINAPRKYRQLPRQLDKNKNAVNAIPVDQFNSQEFNLGLNGLPASDITLLARAQSIKEYELILSRLQEVRTKNPNNKGKSDKQIIGEMMPSWVQTPAEIDKFVDWYNASHPISFEKAVQTDQVQNVGDLSKPAEQETKE